MAAEQPVTIDQLLFSVQDSIVTLKAVEGILLEAKTRVETEKDAFCVIREKALYHRDHMDRILRYFESNKNEVLVGAQEFAVKFALPSKTIQDVRGSSLPYFLISFFWRCTIPSRMSSRKPIGEELVLVKRSRLDELEKKEWRLYHIRQNVEADLDRRSAVESTPARSRCGLFGTSPPLVRFVNDKVQVATRKWNTEGNVAEAVVHEVAEGEALAGAALAKGALFDPWTQTKMERAKRTREQWEEKLNDPDYLPHWDAWGEPLSME